ncbi:MAG: glycosyltransferase family 2 protein [Parcubacteria group bacterium]|nr:glycosyltransferase family 2 protein [Parcubacteria group bacterium]
MYDISVVIPCYNEEEGIEKVIRSIPNGVREIIVVDNNSTDATAEVARGLGARVVFERKQGYGRAFKTGFANAQGTIIATLDGDAQYPAHKIIEVAKFLIDNNLDFILCSRFPLDDKVCMPQSRIIGNKILTLVTNIVFNLSLQDSQSGMWIFRKNILDGIHLKSDDMSFSEEIKIRVATNQKYRFREYHIPYAERSGKSKLFPLKHGIKNLLYLFFLKFDREK